MTAPSVLTGSVTILNQGAIGAAATMPSSFAAGNNRLVWAIISTYDGGSTTNVPTAVACNGRTPTLVAGSTSAFNRTAVGIYQFNEADIPFITNQSLTSTGATGSQKNIEVFLLQDCKQEATPRTNSGHLDATGTLTLSLSRVADSFTFGYAFTSSADTLLTLTNPTRVSSTLFTTRRASYGYASDTERTVNFTVGGSNRTYGLVLNIAPVPAQAITGVNGGTNTVKWGQACTWSTTGFSPAVSSATLAGVTCTSVSGSGFTAPVLTDGSTVPMLGTRVLTGSNTVPASADINVTVEASDDLRDVALAGTLNTTNTGVLYNFSPAAKVGDLILWPTEVDGLGDPLPEEEQTTVDAQGNIVAFWTGTRTFWHISVDAGNANIGVARSYTVTIGEDGVVTNSIVARHIVASSPVARSIVARGI